MTTEARGLTHGKGKGRLPVKAEKRKKSKWRITQIINRANSFGGYYCNHFQALSDVLYLLKLLGFPKTKKGVRG